MNCKVEDTYRNFTRELKIAQRFYKITVYSYDLCSSISDEEIDFDKKVVTEQLKGNKQVSYSPANVEIGKPEIKCEWITLEEFSKRENIEFQEVMKNYEEGKYGEVQIKENQKYIIWPIEFQFTNNRPEFGKKLFKVPVKQKASVNVTLTNPNDIKGYIKTAFKDIDKATSDAQKILNRETYLLFWTSFEQYIKQMALVLFELYPENVFRNKKYSKETMSYLDIYEQSNHMTDISELGTYILNTVISVTAQGNMDSISKTIQFIKDCFLEKAVDPYSTWYVYEGEKNTISYTVLDDIRKLRNVLVHENGKASEDIEQNSLITQLDKDGIIINDDILEREYLILESIGYNVYHCIKRAIEKDN